MVATAGQSFDISLYGKMNKYFFSEIRNLMKSNSTWIIIEIQDGHYRSNFTLDYMGNIFLNYSSMISLNHLKSNLVGIFLWDNDLPIVWFSLCVYLKSKMTVSTDCKGKMNICPRNYKLDWTQPVHELSWDETFKTCSCYDR